MTKLPPPIIHKLASEYSNIKVIEQENQGISVARNNGFKQAQGKYVWFIDSDDTIAINCLGHLVSIMEECSLDALTVGPSIPAQNEFPANFDKKRDLSEIYNGLEFLLDSGKFVVGAWCYILRRDFWKNNDFEFYPGIMYEDTQLMAYAISKTQKIAALTKFSCYNYIQREGSIMHSEATKKKVMSCATIVNTHLKYAQEVSSPKLCALFKNSASVAFIGGMNMIIQMGGNRSLLNDFIGAISLRPTTLYGKSMLHKAFQYVVLHYPNIYITLRKWLKK